MPTNGLGHVGPSVRIHIVHMHACMCFSLGIDCCQWSAAIIWPQRRGDLFALRGNRSFLLFVSGSASAPSRWPYGCPKLCAYGWREGLDIIEGSLLTHFSLVWRCTCTSVDGCKQLDEFGNRHSLLLHTRASTLTSKYLPKITWLIAISAV